MLSIIRILFCGRRFRQPSRLMAFTLCFKMIALVDRVTNFCSTFGRVQSPLFNLYFYLFAVNLVLNLRGFVVYMFEKGVLFTWESVRHTKNLHRSSG